jgi:hypothetical protein
VLGVEGKRGKGRCQGVHENMAPSHLRTATSSVWGFEVSALSSHPRAAAGGQRQDADALWSDIGERRA